MEMHSVANLATLQTPIVTFFPLFKKAPSDKSLGFAQTLFSFWDSLVLLHKRKVLLSQRARTPFSLCASALFSKRRRGAALSVKHRYCRFSNFTCKYSRNHSTDVVIILCVFDFIRRRLDYQDFCADKHLGRESWLCNLNGSRFSHYFICIPLSDNRNSKIYTVLLRI